MRPLSTSTSSEPWRGVLYDIGQKITLSEGPSGGSTYVPFADGCGVHLFADANLVAEADDNSFSSHTAVHEYIHILQQAMLAGEITNTTVGPVPLKATSTSADRFKCINKCGVPAVFCEKSLAVLEALPDTLKLMDRTMYVIWYPHSEDGNEPCTDTDTKKVEIMEEVYGSTCANGEQIVPDIMRNENHLVAEGDAADERCRARDRRVSRGFDPAFRWASYFWRELLTGWASARAQEIDVKALMQNLVSDLLATLNMPEWPSSGLALLSL